MYTARRGDGIPPLRALIICLQLALVGVWMEGMCVCVEVYICACVHSGAGAVIPSDLFTLNHMSNLILVSRLN